MPEERPRDGAFGPNLSIQSAMQSWLNDHRHGQFVRVNPLPDCEEYPYTVTCRACDEFSFYCGIKRYRTPGGGIADVPDFTNRIREDGRSLGLAEPGCRNRSCQQDNGVAIRNWFTGKELWCSMSDDSLEMGRMEVEVEAGTGWRRFYFPVLHPTFNMAVADRMVDE